MYRSEESRFESKDRVFGLFGPPESGLASRAAVMLRNCRESYHPCQLGPESRHRRDGAWDGARSPRRRAQTVPSDYRAEFQRHWVRDAWPSLL